MVSAGVPRSLWCALAARRMSPSLVAKAILESAPNSLVQLYALIIWAGTGAPHLRALSVAAFALLVQSCFRCDEHVIGWQCVSRGRI